MNGFNPTYIKHSRFIHFMCYSLDLFCEKMSDLYGNFQQIWVNNCKKVKKWQPLKTLIDLENQYFLKIQTPSEPHGNFGSDGVWIFKKYWFSSIENRLWKSEKMTPFKDSCRPWKSIFFKNLNTIGTARKFRFRWCLNF